MQRPPHNESPESKVGGSENRDIYNFHSDQIIKTEIIPNGRQIPSIEVANGTFAKKVNYSVYEFSKKWFLVESYFNQQSIFLS